MAKDKWQDTVAGVKETFKPGHGIKAPPPKIGLGKVIGIATKRNHPQNAFKKLKTGVKRKAAAYAVKKRNEVAEKESIYVKAGPRVTSTEKRLDKEVSEFLVSSKSESFPVAVKKNIRYQDFLSDKMLMMKAIRVGIPYPLFELIRSSTPFSEGEWAEFLDISTKTLQRYQQASDRFKPIHSEKILEIAEVTREGLEVFGDMEKLRLWMHTPNFALGKFKPAELLKDSYGKEMVLGELTRISYGILA